MKRAIQAIFCCAFFLASAPAVLADPASDQDMASRYLSAAQSGDDSAQFYLGALYSAGVGVPRSDEEAFRWISRAADQGNSHAMLILSGLYAVGRGVQKDNVKAYQWAYIVGAGSRVDEFRNGSHQLMGVLETRMTPDEVSSAKTEAGRWHAVVTQRPSQTFAPPAPAALPPVATAAPVAPAPVAAPPVAPPPAAPSPQPPANTTSNEPSSPLDNLGKNVKKGDVDSFLDQVPQGLRKKFGF
jgi:hypothetical protein